MQLANNFIVLIIREYLENEDKRLGEDKLEQLLSEFLCPLNMDVERFYSNRQSNLRRNIKRLHIWYYHWKMQNC